ncbi:M23 family metallopeptidase [Thermithiobacillus plumbiphilus]|uniref:M23 family metallopeptidase n=1 Tax=Thermithiobacillus plumbiphilus TaxID=1729899 RepID=A0ABU9D8B4_9PROT
MKFGFAIAAIALNLSAMSLASASEYPFKVTSEKSTQGTAIAAVNDGRFPVDLRLHLGSIAGEHAEPVKILIPAHTRLEVTVLPTAAEQTSAASAYQYNWSIGDPAAEQNAEALYRLPFADGKQYRISQAHGGPVITHNTPDSYYAVDIAMPRGADILAARAGVVTDTESQFGDGGKSEEFRKKANYVRILHDDGTWAEYFHLQKDSVTVQAGQRVEAGMKIGEAGTSGFSDGPHLHFSIQKNVSGRITSLPFRFFTPARGAFAAVAGEKIQADYTSLATAPVDPLAPDTGTATGNPAQDSDQAVGRAE